MGVTQYTGGSVSIAYDIEGGGPVVVFLHGIGGNRTNWGKQLEAFSRQFCAVAWDARGYGASADPPTTLRFSDYADDLQRLLDHLKAETAHLVGLSMGGMIVQDFYARYPAFCVVVHGNILVQPLSSDSSGFQLYIKGISF